MKGLNGNLTNNGKIIGISTSGAGFGMTIGKSKGSELINNGIIAGTSSSANGHGIYLDSATDSSIANTGVIYGSTNAIFIQQGNYKKYR